ncbi:MAG: hypothetical protein CFE45_21565, partial [Burkholderiales bacterium PBB5]
APSQAQVDAQAQADAAAQALARTQAQARARQQAEAQAQSRAQADALARSQAEARARADQPGRAPQLPATAAAAPAMPPINLPPVNPPPLGQPPRAVPPQGAPAAPVAKGPPTVLLADDSKVVRVKTGRLLEKQGWRVLLAEDGESALQLLATDAPDLLITDVEMPGIDGFELTRRVRQHPRWGRLPVIMITSSDEKHRGDAQAAGVNLLMGKPYAEEDLLAQAQRLLGRRVQAGTALH